MANVELSTSELELVTNAHFILTKNTIIGKVYALFGLIADAYTKVTASSGLPVDVLKTSPKISKGENYEGLPWVMLDYPRCFSVQDVFAIRCFFWWGNFCSITLQAKGGYQRLANLSLLDNSNNDWFLCCNNNNEWQHHFRQDNYRLQSSFSKEEIQSLPFIKLAKKIPLQEWDNMETFFKETFQEILCLTAQTVE